MKKRILALMSGILIVTSSAFAAGDLQVNGELGIGIAPNAATKAIVVGTNQRGLSLTTSMDADGVVNADVLKGMQLRANVTGTATGYGNGIGLITDISSTAATVSQGIGGSFIVSLSSNTAGSTTVGEIATGKFDTVFNGGNRNYTVTQGYGFNLMLRDNSYGAAGTLTLTDYRGININNASNDYGRLSAGTLTGLWIDQQTLGGTNNYGIVLNGDGNGADIVFGAAQEARIYSSAGRLYAQDSAGNQTIISPHDPVTGEWIYYSKNTKTGVVKRIDMERLVKAVENLTGEKFMIETLSE